MEDLAAGTYVGAYTVIDDYNYFLMIIIIVKPHTTEK